MLNTPLYHSMTLWLLLVDPRLGVWISTIEAEYECTDTVVRLVFVPLVRMVISPKFFVVVVPITAPMVYSVV